MGKMLTLLILMSVFLVGCKEDVPANATVEDTLEVSDELLTENTEGTVSTEGDVDKDNIDEFTEDTEGDTDVSTENPDEDTKVDNSESITKPDEEDTKDTSSETKEPEETTSSESSTTVVPPVVEEPVTPPVKEEPVTPPVATVPSVSWDGGGVTLGTLGITIPTLRDFNDEALTDNTNNTFWTGTPSTDASQQLYDTLNGVRNAVINAGVMNAKTGQGFAVNL